jgi:peptidoglycan hydrolase CwlO-like protein
MNTLKKIWKWIAGIITGLAAIFVIFKTLQDPGKKEFNKKKKKLEKDIDDVKKQKAAVNKEKTAIKKKIKESNKKIKATEKKVKDTSNAKNTLKDFKKKYKK